MNSHCKNLLTDTWTALEDIPENTLLYSEKPKYQIPFLLSSIVPNTTKYSLKSNYIEKKNNIGLCFECSNFISYLNNPASISCTECLASFCSTKCINEKHGIMCSIVKYIIRYKINTIF